MQTPDDKTIMAKARRVLACLGAGVALGAAPAAEAVTLISASSGGNTLDLSSSSANLVAASVRFVTATPVVITFAVEAEDADGLVAFNAVVTDGSGLGLRALVLSLDGATWASGGAVTPLSGTVAGRAASASVESITFEPAEAFGVDLGNPFAQPGTSDWLIGLGGRSAGDTFTLSLSAVPVPEPGACAMVLGGLGLIGLLQARQRRSRAVVRTAPE